MKKIGKTIAVAVFALVFIALAVGFGFQVWRFFNFTLDVFVASAAVNLTDTLLAGTIVAATAVLFLAVLALLSIAESIGRVAKAIEAKTLIDGKGLKIVFTNRDGQLEEILVDAIAKVPPK